MVAKPVLWHLPISHYNEKARWALAHKGVEHDRRAVPPPGHMAVALVFTRGAQTTFPVLALNGRKIGDSTAIIAALEEAVPDPPLYPDGSDDRRRALELEDWFDEELGPAMRIAAWYDLVQDRDRLEEIAVGQAPKPLARFPGAIRAMAKTFVATRYGVRGQPAAERARHRVVEALDRLESELGEDDYLVGGRFTVADLTAASLFYPLVRPPEGPKIGRAPERFERFRSELSDRPGYRWVAEMFRRHRKARATA